MRSPVQSCPPETPSDPMIWQYTFQTHALVHSQFKKCICSDALSNYTAKTNKTKFFKEFAWNIYALHSTGDYAAKMEINQQSKTKQKNPKSLCQISKKGDMVSTALPRSCTGTYTRLRVEIERHIAIRGEKKGYHIEKKYSYIGYYYVKSGNDKQKASQNIIHNILIWGRVNNFN